MRNYWLTIFFGILAACGQSEAPADHQEMLYVGTFSVRNSEGIYAYAFDRAERTFIPVDTVNGPDSPSFIDISEDGRFLYSANRQGIGPDSTFGSVMAYRIDPATGQLSLLDQSSSYGISPCHIHTDGSKLYLSHYAGGSISVFQLAADGRIASLLDTIHHTGGSVHPERQEAPHLHSIRTLPEKDIFLAADLGTDQLVFYRTLEDAVQTAPLAPIKTEAGAGPRHFTFSSDHHFLFVAEELSSSVSVHQLDLEDDSTEFLQRLSTLPEDFSSPNTVADIHLSPDGRFLYVSNRGHDSLAIFSVDPATGRLQLVGHQSTLGKTPRNFLMDPLGTFLLIANQDTDEIILFDRDTSSGLLEATDTRISMPSPVSLKWLKLR